jgi:hypothetical protein
MASLRYKPTTPEIGLFATPLPLKITPVSLSLPVYFSKADNTTQLHKKSANICKYDMRNFVAI